MKDSILNHVLQRMAGGYAEQIPYYEKMRQLAQSQDNLLAEENLDVEQLMELINQRQQLINKLEDLNSSLLPLKKEVKEALEITEFNLSSIKEKLSGHGVAALSKVFGQLAQLLSEIKEMDRKNEEVLRHCIQATRDELKNLQNLKKVNKAYQAEPTADGGVFIDYSK